MMIRDKNNIFERVENFHADLAWNHPVLRMMVRGKKGSQWTHIENRCSRGDLVLNMMFLKMSVD